MAALRFSMLPRHQPGLRMNLDWGLVEGLRLMSGVRLAALAAFFRAPAPRSVSLLRSGRTGAVRSLAWRS
jgi:hypothetical protein